MKIASFINAALLILILAATVAARADDGLWELAHSEDFEALTLPEALWQPSIPGSTDRYDDDGAYFHERDGATFTVPAAFRNTTAFGAGGWLTAESGTRDGSTPLAALLSVEADPALATNHALRLASPRHNDSTVIRPTWALPSEYKICVRGGFADFGTGDLTAGTNGYIGDERATPWLDMSSTFENGFYWLAILSAVPGPHNNVWIHHQRKAVIDSDNNWYPPEEGGSWCSIWDGERFAHGGEHPIMMFVFDREYHDASPSFERTGPPFVSWAGGTWHRDALVHQIRATDAYEDRQWYDVCIEKTQASWRLTMTGDFLHSGPATLGGAIPRDMAYEAEGTPDYFMFGDPHLNFYRGLVYYDDVRLYLRPGTVWPQP